MKLIVKKALIGFSLILLSGAGSVCLGSPPRIPQLFNISLEPNGVMEKGGAISFDLTFGPAPKYYVCGDTGSLVVMTLTYPGRDTLSVRSWPVKFNENHSYSTTFDINVPDNAVTKLRILLGCGWIEAYPIERTLVTTGDAVQFLEGYMPPVPPTAVKSSDPIRDTLTDAQLDTKYEVLLDLKANTWRSIAERILGQIPNSSKSDTCATCYIMDVSLRNLLKLVDEGMRFKFTTPPPWDRNYEAPDDTKQEKPAETDTEDTQGMSPPPISSIVS